MPSLGHSQDDIVRHGNRQIKISDGMLERFCGSQSHRGIPRGKHLQPDPVKELGAQWGHVDPKRPDRASLMILEILQRPGIIINPPPHCRTFVVAQSRSNTRSVQMPSSRRERVRTRFFWFVSRLNFNINDYTIE